MEREGWEREREEKCAAFGLRVDEVWEKEVLSFVDRRLPVRPRVRKGPMRMRGREEERKVVRIERHEVLEEEVFFLEEDVSPLAERRISVHLEVKEGPVRMEGSDEEEARQVETSSSWSSAWAPSSRFGEGRTAREVEFEVVPA